MQISRKECEKFKMAINFDYDFSGWATKANVKCFDGLTIAMARWFRSYGIMTTAHLKVFWAMHCCRTARKVCMHTSS